MRVVVTINMVGLNAFRRDNFEHPTAGLAIVLVLVAWTAAAIWLYHQRTRRTPVLLVVDLAIAVAALAATPVVIFQFAMSPFEYWNALAWAGAFVVTVFVLLVSLAARAILLRNRMSHE